MKFKNRMKRAATGLLALAMAVTTLLGSTGLTAYAADTEPNPQPPANGERIFSVDPFDSDHSAGYFCVKDTVGNGDVAYNDGEDGEWSGWRGTNGSKSNKIYFDHHNGACFNGTYFDIREYVWQEDCEYYAIRNNGSVAARGTEDGRVFREFHFYESGTLDSGNPVEVEWKGVMRLTDMDIEEGYSFIQGLHAAWLNNPTNVTKRDKVTWRGTWENNSDGVNSEHEMLWVEVEGSPSKPLTIAYWVNKVHASGINYFGNTIKYELVPDGKDDLPPDAKPAVGVHCATYAKYDLMPEDEFIRYEFDGWYYDKGFTKKDLMTPSATYRIELFSGYITTMDSSAYMQTFGGIREHTDWLKDVSGRSDFRANLEISAYDRVITLSTCAYRFENARYVLHGKLVKLR